MTDDPPERMRPFQCRMRSDVRAKLNILSEAKFPEVSKIRGRLSKTLRWCVEEQFKRFMEDLDAKMLEDDLEHDLEPHTFEGE